MTFYCFQLSKYFIHTPYILLCVVADFTKFKMVQYWESKTRVWDERSLQPSEPRLYPSPDQERERETVPFYYVSTHFTQLPARGPIPRWRAPENRQKSAVRPSARGLFFFHLRKNDSEPASTSRAGPCKRETLGVGFPKKNTANVLYLSFYSPVVGSWTFHKTRKPPEGESYKIRIETWGETEWDEKQRERDGLYQEKTN